MQVTLLHSKDFAEERGEKLSEVTMNSPGLTYRQMFSCPSCVSTTPQILQEISLVCSLASR